MQFSKTIAILSIFAMGAFAAPGAPAKPATPKPAPPPKPVAPAPPVVNTQTNTCTGGAPYCCSPTGGNPSAGSDGGSVGTTCKLADTQCNAVVICCSNAQNGAGTANQNCGATNSLQQPVIFKF